MARTATITGYKATYENGSIVVHENQPVEMTLKHGERVYLSTRDSSLNIIPEPFYVRSIANGYVSLERHMGNTIITAPDGYTPSLVKIGDGYAYPLAISGSDYKQYRNDMVTSIAINNLTELLSKDTLTNAQKFALASEIIEEAQEHII